VQSSTGSRLETGPDLVAVGAKFFIRIRRLPWSTISTAPGLSI